MDRPAVQRRRREFGPSRRVHIRVVSSRGVREETKVRAHLPARDATRRLRMRSRRDSSRRSRRLLRVVGVSSARVARVVRGGARVRGETRAESSRVRRSALEQTKRLFDGDEVVRRRRRRRRDDLGRTARRVARRTMKRQDGQVHDVPNKLAKVQLSLAIDSSLRARGGTIRRSKRRRRVAGGHQRGNHAEIFRHGRRLRAR